MKFGKHILAEQVPGWSQYYLDYKALKKIISSLASKRPASEATELGIGSPNTAEALTLSILPAGLGRDEDRSPQFHMRKAAFFFKLERELEKINAFYLEKEAELTTRLETLLAKRRAAASRIPPDAFNGGSAKDHVEWSAVEEGFHLLERDLGKLQQFIEINATGFRKILKKWDKRSKSATKELYLARQVDVQPVFNRQLISELSDTVAACLLDLTDLTVGIKWESDTPEDLMLTQQFGIEGQSQLGPFQDLESNIKKAIVDHDQDSLLDVVRYADSLSQSAEARTHVTRILWKAVIDAPSGLADVILSATTHPFDYLFIDDINGRTCLHEAARVGVLRLVNLCLDNGVQKDKVDAYGRSALHYAAMNGHITVCRRLIEVGLPVNAVDLDNCTPLIYATLEGSLECLRALLEDGHASVQTVALDGDLMPLSIAARAGHVDVVVLLLQHAAPSLPNTNGEYPIHLAAQEGHAEVCRLLVDSEGWDTSDKYNEWTPLFHAARFGHAGCIQVLLHAGSRTDLTDEVGHSAIHYAAWFGHHACISLLTEAIARTSTAQASASHTSPLTSTGKSQGGESDIDAIPSLSLPPPMMPYRVYGHNYLDRHALVQVSIGHLMSRFNSNTPESFKAVRLLPPLSGLESSDRYLHSSPRLKLVITASPAVTAAPCTIPLPLADEKAVFSVQVHSIETLSLEFSMYPNFGTKLIGRATAVPAMLASIGNSHPMTLPILDHRLNIIGEVSFEVNVVKPFSGVNLQIGGTVETYWKSITSPVSTPSVKVTTPRFPQQPIRPLGGFVSAQTSPSAHSVATVGSHSLTHSSITGSFIYLTTQVTRDLQPVVFSEWKLPADGYDLGVSDVSLGQFTALAVRMNRQLVAPVAVASMTELHRRISLSMSSLSDALKVIPPTVGICLEIAYPSLPVRNELSLRHQLDLNDVVNSVLRTVYDTTSQDGQTGRRNVVFTSFSPDVCVALNWKQPNYPVFFSTQCGRNSTLLPSLTSLSFQNTRDIRLSSLNCAVDLCKTNNLLGILVDAELLHQAPSLIQAVKDCGLLIGAFGGARHRSLISGGDSQTVDAFLQDGILSYSDYSKRY